VISLKANIRGILPLRSAFVLGSAVVMLLLVLGSARAEASPIWRVGSISNTSVAPGGQFAYTIELANDGDANTEGEYKLTVTLPEGLSGVSTTLDPDSEITCSDASGATTIECTGSKVISSFNHLFVTLTVTAAPDAHGILTAAFALEGGAAPYPGHTVDPIRVTSAPTEFGIDAFDMSLLAADGEPFKQAAGHPGAVITSIDYNTHTDPSPVVGEVDPVEDMRDTIVDLPAGLVGNPAGLDECRISELAVGGVGPKPACAIDSQVGTASVRLEKFTAGILPLYNMVPPPGVPARFAFDLAGAVVVLDAHVRSSGDYGISIAAPDTPQALPVDGSTLTFWGVPAGPAHTPLRDCPGGDPPSYLGPSCATDAPPAAFFRMPTTCTVPGHGLRVSARADSWADPGDFKQTSMLTHEAPGYPYAPGDWGPEVGTEGCDKVPFDPALHVSLTTDRADSPTGVSVDIDLPSDCWDPKATEAEVEATICQSDMKSAAVTLPEGLGLNAASANGLGACTAAQAGLITPLGSSPVHFDEAPVSCPNGSKIGTVKIDTPLLKEPLDGSVYLAEQSHNPFGSLVAMYLVAEGSGVVIKQAGEVSLDPKMGRLVTTFSEAPQLPFSNLHLELFGGPRATLRTPAACGTYAAQATLVPWSGNGAVERQSSFQISQGCGGGFDPKLSAGTENPLAGSYSPLNLRLTRDDGSQEIGQLQLTLPPGLVGSLKGYTYCPDAALAAISADLGTGASQEATPSCPASSRVGSATVGTGAGPNPFYTSSGRAYLAGPYKGAPVSLAVVVPAVAGPFDLGSVVVRNAIHIDPTNAQLTIDSDPLPTILHGIPLDMRDVRVRYDYTVNPTSCEPMQIGSQITSTQGATASPSVHFQAAGCDHLGFKPRLKLSLSGPTRRAAHPALRAVLKTRPGDANIGGATVLLPKTELLENAHIRNVCTRVQFNAAGGEGAGCPKGSVYGYAKAWTPLLDKPLQGPVYLRSNGGERELPDLVASLDGQIHVDVVGYIDSVHQRIRNRFAVVPDAPVSRFELTMQGGRKGLLANNTELCRAKPRAGAHFSAQNGKARDLRPAVRLRCKRGPRGR
jgi:uncharacterized repeat protein (TIGR01451 family)